ncbi:MAG: response regulator [Bryobacterales bacterium]|nr:response regulator [Bryobacterales bacterium]
MAVPAPARQLDILLAEDNDADTFLTMAAFRDARIPNRIHCVPDGEAAIAFLRRTGEHSEAPRPDLILLDLNLPKLNGFKVLESIKADPELKNIPVVVVSGSDRDDDIQRAYELQVSAFLVKPLEVDEYFAAIRSLKQLWFHAASVVPRPDSQA